MLAFALLDVGESPAVSYSIVVQICVPATIVPLAGLSACGHREEPRLVPERLAKIEWPGTLSNGKRLSQVASSAILSRLF